MSETRENYFILLGLSFDPPVEDNSKIEAAIAAKQQQWSKDQLLAFKKAKASAYLAMLDDIKDVMLNPSKREKEAIAASKIRTEKTKDLENKLKLYSSKGTELSSADLKRLVKAYESFGFNEESIISLFKKIVPKPDPGKDTLSEVITKQQAVNITNYLRQIGTPYISLYEFLGVSPSSSCAVITETARTMKQKILANGNQTGPDAARGMLCGLIVDIFKDAAGKKKYDNYVSITKYGKLNDAIDEIAKSNKNAIDQNMKNSLIEIGQSDYSISLSEASLYIDNYSSFQGYKLIGNTVHCAHCNIEYPAGTETCPKCGKHIVIICPKCGRQNDNITKACQCGFNLEKIESVLASIAKARELLAAKKYAEAEEALVEPRTYWPENDDLKSVENSIKEHNKMFASIEQSITDDITDKKYYSARSRISNAKNEGFEVNPGVIDRVERVISEVESKLVSAKEMDPENAFELLLALSDDISDSDELRTLLAKYPPEPVKDIKYVKNGKDVVVSWNPSTSNGMIEYVLVRKENSYANGTKDLDSAGIEVYRGKECSYTDSGLNPSTVYYYIVVAVRAGINSQVARLPEAVVLVENVSGIKAIGGDSIINLSWQKPQTVTEIKIWIFKGDSQPLSDDEFVSVPCNRLDGDIIEGLDNGRRYWLKVRAYHTISGNSYPSDDLIINAVPEKPADPLKDFQVKYADEKFDVSWSMSEWDVVLFYSPDKPEYAVGVIYDINDLLEKYQKIDFSLRSATEADFGLEFIGECYIIPGVIRATNVILNDAVYVSSIPPVKNPSADVNSSSTELYINFDWPKKIDHAIVLYKTDEYPNDPEDIVAKKIEINKKQYDMDAGILIRDPDKGIFYATIYSYYEASGHRIYSDGVQLLINNEPQREVYYSIKYSKGGLFSKKRTLSVSLRSDGNFTIPPFVVVGRAGLVPGTRDKGFDICSQKEPVDISSSKTIDFEVQDLQKGTKVRLFFLNDKDYSRYRIQNEGNSDI